MRVLVSVMPTGASSNSWIRFAGGLSGSAAITLKEIVVSSFPVMVNNADTGQTITSFWNNPLPGFGTSVFWVLLPLPSCGEVKRYRVRLDVTNVVSETNETNNSAIGTLIGPPC